MPSIFSFRVQEHVVRRTFARTVDFTLGNVPG